MKKNSVSQTGIFHPRILVAVALCAIGTFLAFVGFAANPSTATITPASSPVTWVGTPVGGSAANETACVEGVTCDTFVLTLSGTKTDWLGKKAHVAISWDDPNGVTDYDLYIHKGSPAGAIIGQSAGGDNPEKADIDPNDGAVDVGTGTFYVHVVYFTANATSQYQGDITIVDAALPADAPPPLAPPPPAVPGVPRYYNYSPGPGQGESAGEPSIGYNKTSHKAMFISGLQTFRVTFPDTGACEANWEDVSYIVTKTKSLDPILFTDQLTGRTFVSQLDSVVPPASPVLIGLNSFMAYTDDDGANWTPAQVNPPNGSYDHQSVGAGPYPSSLPLGNPATNKGSAVYYCSQAGVTAICARSDDGGLNFGSGVPIYSSVADGCGGIHGHVKVAPDGTVYVPNRGCNGVQSVTVSNDAGQTWTVHHVEKTSGPGQFSAKAPPGILDPSVGVATDGTLYFSWISTEADGGHAHVAVSHDKGITWDHDVDLGVSYNLHNAVFIEAVAGDPDRAAVGFLGTTASGNHEGDTFKGTWYLFIAHTYDGGQTWTTVNATPNAPVQREAAIWNEGGNSPFRNLLDFNEITIDERGRVLYSYADGCIDTCESGAPNTFSSKATIARQSGGKGLLVAFDNPADPLVPQAACLSGTRDDLASYLKWRTPDNGGNDIDTYSIYRRLPAGSFGLVGQTPGNKNSFNDRSADPSVATYEYEIVAHNAQGNGTDSNIVSLSVGPRLEPNGACVLPGVKVITDAQGDTQVGGQPQHDITAVSIAEVKDDDVTGAANSIEFGIKVVNLTTVPPGFRWAVRFSVQGVTPPTDFSGAASEDFFVAMTSSDGATPTFTWGVTSVPQNASRIFTTKGNLDASSAYATDGTITLILHKSDIGNPIPGTSIFNILGSVRVSGPPIAPNTGGTNETIMDSTGGGSYSLRQDNLCLPNAAPVAVLNATPETGNKPLIVHFDASASLDPDAIDDISAYTFNFGDGGDDVTIDSPTIDHTYTNAGLYNAKLLVTDSRGKQSANAAQHLIEVGRGHLANISGRLNVGTGNHVGIAGFIIQGGGKHVVIRGIGPSLSGAGLSGVLQNPILELHNSSGGLITMNDNWQDTQKDDIQATGLAPNNPNESAILTFLPEGTYTAVLKGVSNGTGLGLVDIFDLNAVDSGELANLSVRANVGTGNNVLINGLILSGAVSEKVLFRAIGPSLVPAGIPDALLDPMLELHDANGALIASNDDWQSASNAGDVSSAGLAPSDSRESAIYMETLNPGSYTCIVMGKGNITGVSLAEIYKVN